MTTYISRFRLLKKIIFIVACLNFPTLSVLKGDQWYSEYWQKLHWKMWEKDEFSLRTYVKFETGNHLKKIRSLQISEQLSYHFSENMSIEIHYTYLHGHSVTNNSLWQWQHRLELESNRKFKLSSDNFITTRNRLEIRRLQNDPKTRFRLRQLTKLVIPFENAGNLQSFSLYNELFYDFTTHLFSQNRFCPAQVTFVISKTIRLDLFFLVRFFRSNNNWQKSAVLGTQVNF